MNKEVIKLEKIYQSIAEFNEASSQVVSLYCEWVKSKGMNYNEFLMYYILLEGNKTQKQLSMRTHLIKQTVNNIVKSMLENGFVILKENPDNYKEKYVELTEKGRKKAHEVADEIIEIENRTVRKMGEDKIQQLVSLSQMFGDILKEEMK